MPRRKTKTKTETKNSPSPARPLRWEWIAIVVITLLAAGLRLAFPERIAIEHFDEGVYASNIFFSEAQGGAYPYRFLYAPPLLPWLIEWGIIFLGPESIAPFLPALVLGIATVPLMWWVGRSWFGPWAGLAAALLVATSNFHILYSRAAMTDVPVMFFIVLAVFLFIEAVLRNSLKWAIFAGLATGLAWWTKYTGWLPLAIAGAGSAAWVLGDLRPGWSLFWDRTKRVVRCWGAMAITAGVIFLPVLYGLQEHGGYAAVAENHAGYLISEWTGWFENAVWQLRRLMQLSGLLTALVVAFLVGALPLRRARQRWWDVPCAVALGGAALLATMSYGPVFTMGLLAVIGPLAEAFWRLRRPIDDHGERGQSTLPLWLLAAWFVGMTLATPFYTPYPRMMFPWIFAALFLSCRWLVTPDRTRVPREGWSQIVTLGIFTLFMIPGVMVALHEDLDDLLDGDTLDLVSVPQWQDRADLKRMSAILADEIREELEVARQPALVYVVGEPAVFFHLSVMFSDEEVAIIPAGSLASLQVGAAGIETFAVVGLASRSRSRVRTQRAIARANQFQRTAILTMALSDLVKLDSTSNVLYGPPQLVLLHAGEPPE